MGWDRLDRPVKRGSKCQKCYKRQRTLQKNKATRQQVEEIQSLDLGEHHQGRV